MKLNDTDTVAASNGVHKDINKKNKPAVTKISDITYSTAFWIGMFQLVAAVFPGMLLSM